MMTPLAAFGLTLVLVFAVLILFFASRAAKARVPILRPIAAFDNLKDIAAQTKVSGGGTHLALGVGRITDASTAETLAGVEVLSYLAENAAQTKTAPFVTTADPAAAFLAQHTVRNALHGDKTAIEETGANVRWISPQPAAYAAGVMSTLSQEDLRHNVLIGKFGDEFLLMGEAGYRQHPPLKTVAGATDPNVLPYVMATSPQGLWGEEIFAAGAYLAEKPTHIGSLLAQDAFRWGVGLTILGGVIIKAFGVW